jgi:hypothetical protein
LSIQEQSNDDDDDDDEDAGQFVSQQVFQKFLIGTEKCEKLEVNDVDQLRTLAQVAVTHPKSLKQLRELKAGTFIFRSVVWVETEPEKKAIWETFHKVKISTQLPMIST